MSLRELTVVKKMKLRKHTHSVIGQCCSDFTVEYVLLVMDKFYVAYFDASHNITVASREFQADKWNIAHPLGKWLPDKNRFMHQTEYDSHNYLTLAMDRAGHLHLSGNMHRDKMVWFCSEKPGDIHSLLPFPMTGQREDSVTYPLFFYGRDGELLFRYRDGESGNGDDIYNRWNEESRSWQRLLDLPLLSGGGECNAYARLPVFGPDKQWHMIWMWRDTPHCETCHDLSYARSPDLLHWFTYEGTPLHLPVTPQRGDRVDPSPVRHGLINMSQNLGFDVSGRPLVTWHRYDAAGNSQAWIARPSGGRWHTTQISHWNFRWDFSGAGSIAPEVTISAPVASENRIIVSFQHGENEHGRWYLDADTLALIETRHEDVTPLPTEYYCPQQHIHPTAQVQIVPELYITPPTHFLRWEALPIQRDISSGQDVRPSLLELVSLDIDPAKIKRG